MFAGGLHALSPIQEEASRSASALAGQVDAASLAGPPDGERATLWVLLAVSTANVVLGIWRPRLTRIPSRTLSRRSGSGDASCFDRTAPEALRVDGNATWSLCVQLTRGINPGTPVPTTELNRTFVAISSRISCMASSGNGRDIEVLPDTVRLGRGRQERRAALHGPGERDLRRRLVRRARRCS